MSPLYSYYTQKFWAEKKGFEFKDDREKNNLGTFALINCFNYFSNDIDLSFTITDKKQRAFVNLISERNAKVKTEPQSQLFV